MLWSLLLTACFTLTPEPASVVEPSSAFVPPAGPPNLLVVVLDDVGVDQIGAYPFADDPPALPTLEGIAARGVRFDQAYVSPSCSQTRAMLVTGRYGRRTDIGVPLLPGDRRELAPDEVGIAEVLATAPTPYSAALAGKWHLSSKHARLGLRHPVSLGFASYAITMGNVGEGQPQGATGDPYHRWFRVVDGVREPEASYATTVQADDALAYARTLPEPWLLWFAPNAPHGPWLPPPPSLNPRGVVAADGVRLVYRAMLEAVDAELGRVLAGLSPEVAARTTVVVIGDNGTPPEAVARAMPSGQAKGSLHDLGTRVPLLVAGPGVSRPGTATDALVHGVDLFPTLAALGGIDPDAPGGAVWPTVLDGRSFAHLLQHPEESHRDVIYQERFGRLLGRGRRGFDERSVRSATHRLVVDAAGHERLYRVGGDDLAAGRDLLRDASSMRPSDRVAYGALWKELKTFRGALP